MTYIPPTAEGWTSQKFGTNPGGYNPAGGHTGEDIAIPIGTPLVAMADGVVVHVGPFSGKYTDNPWWIMPSFAGFVVTVDYGEYLSHYAHCSGSPVLSGKRVAQGDVVAYSGNTGGATSGPHCHWEVMRDGWDLQSSTYGRIDPRSIIGAPIAAQGDITPPAATTEATESEEDFMGGTIDAGQAEDIAKRAAELVLAGILDKIDNKVRINPVQAESIVKATTSRTVDGVDARNTGKLIDRGQADDIARAAALYSKDGK
jgi:murein DD-endopeptidase MepM/ murein hydrolase activator NlpD